MTTTPDRRWKPTILMGLVSEELERAGTPLTIAEIISRVAAHKPRITRDAVACLIEDGHLTITPRRRYARRVLQRVELVRPYRPPQADVEKHEAIRRRLEPGELPWQKRKAAAALRSDTHTTPGPNRDWSDAEDVR